MTAGAGCIGDLRAVATVALIMGIGLNGRVSGSATEHRTHKGTFHPIGMGSNEGAFFHTFALAGIGAFAISAFSGTLAGTLFHNNFVFSIAHYKY